METEKFQGNHSMQEKIPHQLVPVGISLGTWLVFKVIFWYTTSLQFWPIKFHVTATALDCCDFKLYFVCLGNFKAVSSEEWNPWQMGWEVTSIRCQGCSNQCLSGSGVCKKWQRNGDVKGIHPLNKCRSFLPLSCGFWSHLEGAALGWEKGMGSPH